MNLKVWVDGKDYILNEKNWITSGGEADIYRIKDKAFKIFKNTLDRNLDQRVMFASKWSHLNIARPEQIIKGKDGSAVGIVMPWLSGNPILMAFNNNWRQTNNIDLNTNANWTEQIRLLVSNILATGAKMVDANEWNYLICNNNIWAIDSDSWCIPGMHATAQMPSIKDWHSPVESEASDWFAAAIVTFQLWAGIHPYKGTYAPIKKGDLQERMKQNISVLHKDVKVPSTTRNWNDIPKGLLRWYKEMFEDGNRIPMPALNTWTNTNVFIQNTITKTICAGILKAIFITEGVLKGNILKTKSNYINLKNTEITWLQNKTFNFVAELEPDIYTAIFLDKNNLNLITEYTTQIIPNIHKVWCTDNLIWTLSQDNMLEAYTRSDIQKHSYFKQIGKWPRNIHDTQRNGNVPYAIELGGLCMWYEQDNYPIVQRMKDFDGHKVLKVLQIKNMLLVATKKTKKDNTNLYLYDTKLNQIVYTQEIPEENFTATAIGEHGIIIVINDGEALLWNGKAISAITGDILLDDDILTYEGKPHIWRNNKLFRLSNKT